MSTCKQFDSVCLCNRGQRHDSSEPLEASSNAIRPSVSCAGSVSIGGALKGKDFLLPGPLQNSGQLSLNDCDISDILNFAG